MRNQENISSGEAGPKNGPLPSLHPLTGSAPKTLVSEETFRSPGGVNKTDNMVRVTIDMPRTVWREWRRVMFPPNAEGQTRQTGANDE